jgi:hypothetical protein
MSVPSPANDGRRFYVSDPFAPFFQNYEKKHCSYTLREEGHNVVHLFVSNYPDRVAMQPDPLVCLHLSTIEKNTPNT